MEAVRGQDRDDLHAAGMRFSPSEHRRYTSPPDTCERLADGSYGGRCPGATEPVRGASADQVTWWKSLIFHDNHITNLNLKPHIGSLSANHLSVWPLLTSHQG